ncbi:tautomerase family protein [Bradyrhizobium tunisiense]|uniref:tautomerase family protein n=1 Tax=Bradyrhizobium tunisiense TaxID=3278709 RepID=UPI0035DD450E
MICHPTFLGRRDPNSTVVIEITLLEGRSDVQKEALYKDVRGRLAKIGFDPANSIVFLTENKRSTGLSAKLDPSSRFSACSR